MKEFVKSDALFPDDCYEISTPFFLGTFFYDNVLIVFVNFRKVFGYERSEHSRKQMLRFSREFTLLQYCEAFRIIIIAIKSCYFIISTMISSILRLNSFLLSFVLVLGLVFIATQGPFFMRLAT